MNNRTELVSTLLKERIIKIDHSSGIPLYIWPRAGYSSAYALFATRYGSIDNAFTDTDGHAVTVPAGIAHYLEHKLFENEDCDAFERYAVTGASANAYTSFDRTAYLFSCTDRLEDSLDILLDFVQKPYFTDRTVEKERGIIGQEIRMCTDSPGREVFINLLRALYHRHPVNIDIAGTEESIAKITPELLYTCHEHFYNLRNMALIVVGNVTEEQVLAAADRAFHPAPACNLTRPAVDEPCEAVSSYVEKTMTVAAPLFYFGFKEPMPADEPMHVATPREVAEADVLAELLAGTASPLYKQLMDAELINDSFGAEFFEGPGYGTLLFGGESKDPKAVKNAILEEIDRLSAAGIDPDDFENARRAVYGRSLRILNDVESCGDMLLGDVLSGRAPFAVTEALVSLTVEDVLARLRKSLVGGAHALSVILPTK